MNGLSLDAIFPIHYLPILEMLIINLVSADQCLHKKYSRAKTLLIFLGFTLLLYGAILIFAGTSFKGDCPVRKEKDKSAQQKPSVSFKGGACEN